ncbi:hypothetical protein GCG21_08605 [Pseudactinotalea sp. HY160]|uniref:hypothetical protein n=1 Tax=Pseudactinotalea sp. HY160 TaxID=2654490 RepID=UPI00128BF967|nr:hypothetical protein [Pseudactinotalea sp. HY160]MPV50064.1 hypothetical protein [Pseudactinotalea sp. HY160]
MSTRDRTRQPAGTPTGGQFAEDPRPASPLSLASPPAGVHDAGGDPLPALMDLMRSGSRGQDDYLDQVPTHLPHLDTATHEADLFQPATLALAEGRPWDAEELMDIAARLNDREGRWRSDPTFREPVIVTEPANPTYADSTYGHSTYGDWRVGARYDQFAQPKQIASQVRSDIAAAVEAGYLPGGPGVTYRVRSANTGGDRSVYIHAHGLDDAEMLAAGEGTDGLPQWRPTAYARLVRQRLTDLGCQYVRSRIATEHDYAHVSTWIDVGVQTRHQAHPRSDAAVIDRTLIAAMHGQDAPAQ